MDRRKGNFTTLEPTNSSMYEVNTPGFSSDGMTMSKMKVRTHVRRSGRKNSKPQWRQRLASLTAHEDNLEEPIATLEPTLEVIEDTRQDTKNEASETSVEESHKHISKESES